MTGGIFFGGSVAAATVAGMIALFAPCCISVMLPAYFASSFQNRRVLVAMTLLFATGVATIVLPIAMGAAIVRRLITDQHTPIYVASGLLMLGLALYLLLGGQIHLPMPGRRAGGRAGPLSVYTLGIFSGAATSCCAPVLAGVIALSGVASSFGAALLLGTAYVFGMVAPLFVISLLWDAFDWRASRLFRPRSLTLRLGSFERSVSATNLASGLLLAVMGLGMIWIGLTSDGMPASADWQIRLTARLEHVGSLIAEATAWLPGWTVIALLIVGITLLVWRGFHQMGWLERDHGDETDADVDVATSDSGDDVDDPTDARREGYERQHA